MWICKECGGEIIATIEINEDFDFSLDKYGNPDEYKTCDLEDMEEIIKHKRNIVLICCDECENGRNTVDELKEIAVWED